MKSCYVDITAGSDPSAILNRNRTTMTELQRDYPTVKFIYSTVPLTVGANSDNVERQRFNLLVREANGAQVACSTSRPSSRPDPMETG